MRRARYKKRRVRFKVNKKFLWLGVVLIIFFMLLFYLGKVLYSRPLFSVEKIISNVNLGRRAGENIQGKPLFALNTEKLHSLILNRHPEYKEVHILKLFPSTLKVEVKKRRPFAQWKGEKFYLLDREGMVINDGKAKPYLELTAVEIVDGNYPLHKGYLIKDARLQRAFLLLQELEKSNLRDKFDISLINATNTPALYFMIANSKIIVGEGNFKRKIYLLGNLIKEKLKSDLSSVEYIDLRHKKIYIGYKR